MTAEMVNPEVSSPTQYSPISVIANETRVAYPSVTATVLIMRSGADDQSTGTFLTPFNTGIERETTNNSTLAVGALARMSPEERATFVAMLQHVLAPADMSRSTAPSRSESVVTAPPPYT